MKNVLIPVFCLWHLCALSWWTLPHSFGALVEAESGGNSLEVRLFHLLSLDQFPALQGYISRYDDLTGSQQYWDFFAPHSIRFHQYLSVCRGIQRQPDPETLRCQNAPLFSNFNQDYAEFRLFGSDRSRIYRLTENLVNRQDPSLFRAFADHYRMQANYQSGEPVYLITHQFELHPELNDLPRSGYRSDQILLELK